jgi:benzil reductase ((S)-benzoin forming)
MAAEDSKVAVITGASSGLGRSIALDISRKGVRVALLARRAQLLKELEQQITSEGNHAISIPADVSDGEAVARAFGEVTEHYHRVDLLFNAAGVLAPIKPLASLDERAFTSGIAVNILGLVYVIRQALKRMLEQPDGGTIINITSAAAYHAYPSWTLYASSKAAMDMITRCVALEVEQSPVRIAAIAPGIFESHMQQTIRSTPDEDFRMKQKFVQLHEEGRVVGPEIPAGMIVDISLSDWPELNGMVVDVRSIDFQQACQEHGIAIPGAFKA